MRKEEDMTCGMGEGIDATQAPLPDHFSGKEIEINKRSGGACNTSRTGY